MKSYTGTQTYPFLEMVRELGCSRTEALREAERQVLPAHLL